MALHLAGRVGSLEEVVAELEARDEDPRELVARAIDQTSDEDLISITAAITRIDAETLRRSHDVRVFARRLAEVAINGVTGDEAPMPGNGRVRFAASAADDDPDAPPQQTFPSDQGKLYAIVELPEYAADDVILKWSHVESGKIYVFSRHSISRDTPIWAFHDPPAGWAEGGYRVDVFTADDAVAPLARGEYAID